MAPKRDTDFHIPAAARNRPAPPWAVTGTLLACLTACFVILTRLISSNSGTDAKLLPSPANLVPAFTPIQHSQIQLQSAPTQPIKKPTGSYSNPETRNTPAPALSYAALNSVERPVSEHGPAPAIPAAESIPKKDDRKAEVKKSQSMAPGQPRVDPLPGGKKKKAKNCNPKIPVAANLSLPNGCEWWGVMHKKFVVDIQEADAGEGFDIIFYGDSLTEMWRGTRSNQPYAPRSQMPGVFKAHFGSHHRAIALGMSGDTTGNVRWRLMHGELPRLRHPAAVVLLVGTNDLRDARVAASALKVNKGNLVAAGLAVKAAAPSIADRTVAIVNLMRERMPAAVIVLVGILPRHKMNQHGPLVWPNMYSEGLELVNARLEAFAETASNVSYIDCGQPFFATPELLNADLMPDALHPSAAGVEILAACIRAALEGVLGAILI